MHITRPMEHHYLYSIYTHENVSEGTTEVQEVKRALKHYVHHSLCADVKPTLTDCVYYLMSIDVHNHI